MGKTFVPISFPPINLPANEIKVKERLLKKFQWVPLDFFKTLENAKNLKRTRIRFFFFLISKFPKPTFFFNPPIEYKMFF